MLRHWKSEVALWGIISGILIIFVLFPSSTIIWHVFDETNENWLHIKQYLLTEYIINTILIAVSTGVLSIILGVGLAWLVSVYSFPFRSFFKWALVLPLAIPPYIAAYTYTGLLGYTGVIQTFFRNTFALQIDQKYMNIISIEGAVAIFSLFLFPYVYTITRAFLEKQSASLIESSRVLGKSPTEIFFRIILPLSRAAIFGGTSLVILEVLNDYGVVQYFGITTFSTAIFRTWFALGDVDTAIKLSGLLMGMVIIILVIEKFLRGRKKYSYTTTKVRPITRIQLKGVKAALASGCCFVVFMFSFLIPILQLFYWALLTYEKTLDSDFLGLMLNSVITAGTASILIVSAALVIANYSRISENFIGKAYSKIAVLGYSIPGAVISIGVIVFFVALDNRLFWLYKIFDPGSAKLVLSSSIVMLIFAYVIRFLAVGFNSIEAGFEKVGKKFFEASRTLGMSVTRTFFRIDIVMIRQAVLTGFVLAVAFHSFYNYLAWRFVADKSFAFAIAFLLVAAASLVGWQFRSLKKRLAICKIR